MGDLAPQYREKSWAICLGLVNQLCKLSPSHTCRLGKAKIHWQNDERELSWRGLWDLCASSQSQAKGAWMNIESLLHELHWELTETTFPKPNMLRMFPNRNFIGFLVGLLYFLCDYLRLQHESLTYYSLLSINTFANPSWKIEEPYNSLLVFTPLHILPSISYLYHSI